MLPELRMDGYGISPQHTMCAPQCQPRPEPSRSLLADGRSDPNHWNGIETAWPGDRRDPLWHAPFDIVAFVREEAGNETSRFR